MQINTADRKRFNNYNSIFTIHYFNVRKPTVATFIFIQSRSTISDSEYMCYGSANSFLIATNNQTFCVDTTKVGHCLRAK